MNRRGWKTGLVVLAMLAGATVAHAGLSSTDRTSQFPSASVPDTPPAFNTIDPALVGIWEIPVSRRGQQSIWVWQILGDGTYHFHVEPNNLARPHEGVMTAANGHWTLRTLKGLRGWTDSGTYEVHDTIAVITGKLGTGAWKRRPE